MKSKYSSIFKLTIILFLFFHWSTLKSQDVCSFIKKLQEYQDSVRIFSYKDSYEIDTLTFQLESYLNIFDKLKKAPERQFKIYYLYAILHGYPIIYSIPKDFDIGMFIEEKIKKSPGPKYRINNDLTPDDLKKIIFYDFVNDSARRAFNFLIPEDSNLGYLQYLFFYIMGEQFALFWHSLDFQKKILCTDNDKTYIQKTYGNNKMLYMDKKELRKLNNINFSPIIIPTKSYYYITWYELETHNGLYKREYEINRSSPIKVREVSSTKVIEIHRTFVY